MSFSRSLRRAGVAGLATAGLLAGTVGMAGQAQAANPCNFPYFCLYYNSNLQGGIANFYQKDPNFNNDKFAGSGGGVGTVVKNNAASAKNTQTGIDAWVWFNSNYGGSHDVVTRSSWRNLSATYNNNASFDWHS